MLTSTHAVAPPDRAVMRRVIAASGLGTLIEYFDYASYSYLATTIAVVFFPSEDRSVALLSTFAVFGLSFLVRPLGALLWGILGDRMGRKRVLGTTILLMSGSTLAIGLVPGYSTIGVAAPALLLLLRITQSFSAAGEYAGAGTFIAEYSPDKRRGLLTGFVPMSSAAGFLLASVMATLMYANLSAGSMESWGWRLPFLMAGPLGLIGLYLRFRLEDTPEYLKLADREYDAPKTAQQETGHKPSFMASLPRMGRLLLVMALNAGGYYLLLSYIPTYLIEETGMSQGDSNLVVTISLVCYIAIIPCTAALSDRFGRRRILLAACVLLIALSYPLMMAISVGGVLVSTVVLVVFLTMFSLNDAVFPSFFAETFTTRSRYLGFALPFNVGAALFGGVAPYVGTWLISWTGSSYSPAFFLIAVALLSLIGVAASRETARKPLPTASG
ncbi:MFS transporter [Streptomyces sp. NBC_01453]|uniref:MFS transporter n=1 Tax=Streptomyces sp. NBC_01453 TaxID=2903873 RepID=UPI002E282A43|nr:MFS transporter [Streptomyces sp. NBC_01453]